MTRFQRKETEYLSSLTKNDYLLVTKLDANYNSVKTQVKDLKGHRSKIFKSMIVFSFTFLKICKEFKKSSLYKRPKVLV